VVKLCLAKNDVEDEKGLAPVELSCTAALTGAVVTLGGLQIAQPRQAPQSVAKFRKIRISFPFACLNHRRDWLRLVSFSYALIIGEIWLRLVSFSYALIIGEIS
jgi:hypothetical protein